MALLMSTAVFVDFGDGVERPCEIIGPGPVGSVTLRSDAGVGYYSGPYRIVSTGVCYVCHESVRAGERGSWTHGHTGEADCGTGDGSTAYPEHLARVRGLIT